MNNAPMIMVVEDELLTAESICSSLRRYGYRIASPAETHDHAMNALREGRGTAYDQAVVDACISLFEQGFNFAAA